ncbi:MAG TPA: hypothetical protein VMT32_05665 [Bryobacteraceae bacterium]|nr:hypothetical protein [Bryobacteraceae bacterium]
MLSLRPDLVSLCAAMLLASSPAAGQSVISARSGVVHFFEGAVYVGDHPLVRQFGTFPDIPEGAELRTAQGRVEVLLTPDVILRIAENTAIRMLSNDLSDTRVELLNGSGILESADAHPDNSVTMIYRNWRVRFRHPVVYRIDSEPPGLRVNRGEAEVSADKGTPVTVKGGETLPFAEVLVPDKATVEPGDEFSDWAMDRSQAVLADNAVAGQIVDDPSAIDNSGLPVWGYTYFPQIGTPAAGAGLWTPYGSSSWTPYSLYFPGYAYRGLYTGWLGSGRYIGYPRIGIPRRPGAGVTFTAPHTPAAPHAPPPVHVPPPRVVAPRIGHH